jgi:hypothetical protein
MAPRCTGNSSFCFSILIREKVTLASKQNLPFNSSLLVRLAAYVCFERHVGCKGLTGQRYRRA